ncbi:hypothetical protein LRP30_01835 [Bradyrhizobium sp. C-145]|uniref:hypothetical protein n=1 Tax=Bradyrhizobium sp. C-145 TaxID=574727 RepID=UPI00201B4CC2|nr:hypothetical protein [Bradyrhizobium sp. C-145]UQR64093.1 hypothetical protein LRP30_01835 [Bradyrhizobium sp. C-145]
MLIEPDESVQLVVVASQTPPPPLTAPFGVVCDPLKNCWAPAGLVATVAPKVRLTQNTARMAVVLRREQPCPLDGNQAPTLFPAPAALPSGAAWNLGHEDGQ